MPVHAAPQNPSAASPSNAGWGFVLTDANYVPQGELLNAFDRKIDFPLNQLWTTSFRTLLTHPLADLLLSEHCYVKAYRNGLLRFFGPVISAEEATSGGAGAASLVVNAAGPDWYLAKRLGGQAPKGTNYSAVNSASVFTSELTATNALRDTGIAIGSAVGAGVVTYIAGPYKPVSDIRNDLALSANGFDWKTVPIDNWANGAVTGTKIGTFTAAPSFGVDQPNVLYEYGTGRHNVAGYKRQVTRDGQATKVYHLPDSFDTPAATVVTATDTAAVTEWGQLEDLISASLLDSNLRQQLANKHIAVRKNPRVVIEFTPISDPTHGASALLPSFGTDFDVGDTIRARAMVNGTLRFDAIVRVWGVGFALDNDTGKEQMTLTLVPTA